MGKELARLRRPRRLGAGRGLRPGCGSRLVLDHFRGRRRLGLWRGLAVALGHLLLETLDSLGEVAHQARNLACAEQEHEHKNDEKPVPDAAETHENLPAPNEPVLRGTMAAKRGRSQAAGVARARAAYFAPLRLLPFSSNTSTAPSSTPIPISLPTSGASLSRTRAKSEASSPCTAISTSATSPRKRRSRTRAGMPSPAASRRTPRWRTQTMASSPSARLPAGKMPSTVLALPFSILAGTSFKSEKVRAARMSLGAR